MEGQERERMKRNGRGKAEIMMREKGSDGRNENGGEFKWELRFWEGR